eukprot:CAMPEP_0174712290 /NCGR_PEP_ID=MMETSP1094-20130205/13343_1 /TAXON_ID=156173 /ORGANISM="Chrysochromulina brevifilum, Strain UTEX LB 985" /LENGTH=199 /DNA_ID=CAMNT_0015911347 /DNA_START=124 /DNA_END=723 /DNA_ORIENTATION=-
MSAFLLSSVFSSSPRHVVLIIGAVLPRLHHMQATMPMITGMLRTGMGSVSRASAWLSKANASSLLLSTRPSAAISSASGKSRGGIPLKFTASCDGLLRGSPPTGAKSPPPVWPVGVIGGASGGGGATAGRARRPKPEPAATGAATTGQGSTPASASSGSIGIVTEPPAEEAAGAAIPAGIVGLTRGCCAPTGCPAVDNG